MELKALDSLRKGRETPLDIVDKRGQELLRKYRDEKDQGRIYYQLAHIHAQSGLVQPARAIEYAETGLKFPLEPSQRSRLYVYLGDARLVAEGDQPFTSKRKLAATGYLGGLKEVSKMNLPEKAPDLPSVFKYDVISDQKSVHDEIRKKHEQAMQARENAKLQGEMIKHRDVLTGQLVGLYSRKPFATEELEKIAGDVLQDPASVDRLMTAVRAGIEKATARMSAAPVPKALQPVPPPKPTSRLRIYVIAASGLFVAGVLVVLLRRAVSGRPPTASGGTGQV